MNYVLRCFGVAIIVVGFSGITNNSGNQNANADWTGNAPITVYWGTCNIPGGAAGTCTACSAPAGCTPIGAPIGGASGCNINLGLVRGDDCEGLFETCEWFSNRCGFIDYAMCITDPVTFLWVPVCQLTTNTNDNCAGCR